jgi:hypothetical protein
MLKPWEDGGEENCYGILVEKLERERQFGRQGLDCMILLQWILKNWDEWPWTGFIQMRGARGGLL